MVERADFENQLNKILQTSRSLRLIAIQVNSGELHRLVGDYPGKNHRMPVCCSVMRNAMKSDDRIISKPPKGQGATLTIEYKLT